MSPATSRIGAAFWRKARSNVGIRFTRFTVVAVASVVASQVALSLLLGPGHQTAGFSRGVAAGDRCRRGLRAEPLGLGTQGPPESPQGDAAVLAGVGGRVDRAGVRG